MIPIKHRFRSWLPKHVWVDLTEQVGNDVRYKVRKHFWGVATITGGGITVFGGIGGSGGSAFILAGTTVPGRSGSIIITPDVNRDESGPTYALGTTGGHVFWDEISNQIRDEVNNQVG